MDDLMSVVILLRMEMKLSGIMIEVDEWFVCVVRVLMMGMNIMIIGVLFRNVLMIMIRMSIVMIFRIVC